MSTQSSLDITLLGREYRVACPPDERESLLAAVAYVDVKMKDIAAKTKSTGERLAVMTALNLAHELLVPKDGADATSASPAGNTFDAFDRQEFARRIDAIEARLDEAMAEQDKLF
jgi:cell division protein ZapA